MSIADKITRLQTAKDNIADAIIAQGGAVSEGDGFEEFANDIGTIQTGGDLESFIAGTSTSVTYEGEIVRDCAFAGMSELEEVNLPNATYIGRAAFHNYYTDERISDPSEGDLAFDNHSLTTVHMPKVTNIMQSAFDKCIGLTSIDLPNTLIRIGHQAFSYSGLESIVIPDSVLYINDQAFYHCNNLINVQLPNHITVIPYACFNECDSLESIIIPDGVTLLDNMAFSYCDNLATAVLPKSITRINSMAFGGCGKLNVIDLTAFESTDTVPTLARLDVFDRISNSAKFYFKDQATLDNFAAATNWSTYSSRFTTDPVPTPSE